MALTGTGSFYYYQAPIAGLRRSTASNLHLPTVYTRGNNLTSHGESKKPSRRLKHYDLIEVVDMTGPPPEEPPNPFYVPVPDLDCTERDAEDTSNGLITACGYRRSGGEKDRKIPPVEELLLGAGETQERQRTGSSDGQATGGSEGNSEPTADLDQSIVPYNTDSENDSDAFEAVRKQPPPQFKYPSIPRPYDGKNRASSTRNEPGSPGNPIVVEDDNTDSRGDGTSKEQVGNHVSLGTSPTSGGGSEARSRYLNLHENSERDTSNTSPLYRNTLRRPRASKRVGPKAETARVSGLMHQRVGTRRIRGTVKRQRRATRKKIKRDTIQMAARRLHLTKEQRPSAIKERSVLKCHVKRRRCLSPERD